MIRIGDLVKSENSGKVGIVVAVSHQYVNYCYVLFHDSTYSIHTSQLTLLEEQ